MPMLRNNIISLGQLAEDGNKVVLDRDLLLIHDKRGRLLMKVTRSANRLYKISLEERAPICLLTKAKQNTWWWHSRMGYVNFQALTLMSKEGMAHGLQALLVSRKTCEGCLISKQVRKSFPSQTMFHAKERLELIHGDICEPIYPPTPARNRYFLLLVDDYSRKIWVYMLKEKGEAFEAFKKFRSAIEKESGSVTIFSGLIGEVNFAQMNLQNIMNKLL